MEEMAPTLTIVLLVLGMYYAVLGWVIALSWLCSWVGGCL